MKKIIKWDNQNLPQGQIINDISNYASQNNSIYDDVKITNDSITFTLYSKASYEELVSELIAERYTIQDELAIQRKFNKGVNVTEYEEYDAYVEYCKARAKEFIAERDVIVNG